MKVGPVFSEYIHTEKTRGRGHYDFSGDMPHVKPILLLIFLTIGLTILLGRLFWMQIIQGNYYKDLSDSNRIRTVVIHAPRGVIFDRNGKPLVYNVPGFRENVNGKTKLLSQKDAIDLLAKGDNHLEVDSLRNYPYKDAFAHVLGYIGQISADDLKKPTMSEYKSGDLIGQMGVEQSYESVLKGLDGESLYEVDASGKPLRKLGETDPIPGQNITLTLNADLQQKVFSAMKNVEKGAAIVSTPNGEILAMVSKPSFDPNLFTMGKHYSPDASDNYQKVQDILLGSAQPLLDRAISGVYPPGSTYKIVVAGAALQDKVIDDQFTVDDTGILRIGNFSFANWYYTDNGKTEGLVNVVKAIKRSNDIFFYKVGQMVGVDRLSAFSQKFGLGHLLGIDLRGEASGLVPTKEWKEKVIGDQWYLGDDYHLGIGQGYLLTTPLQVNAWTQAISNGGVLYVPHVLKSLSPKIAEDNLLSDKNFSLIREGMIEACQPTGVAWPLFNFKVKNSELKIDGKNFLQPETATASGEVAVNVACKTGTAQHGDAQTMPDSWITLFAPAYNPKIVVTVLAEDSGEGSNVAGPIAKEILTDYFGK
ncbi:MAG TPA: penicillin-binding transpeptidase domain-containing protein [Patescibacteria group bacterium]